MKYIFCSEDETRTQRFYFSPLFSKSGTKNFWIKRAISYYQKKDYDKRIPLGCYDGTSLLHQLYIINVLPARILLFLKLFHSFKSLMETLCLRAMVDRVSPFLIL